MTLFLINELHFLVQQLLQLDHKIMSNFPLRARRRHANVNCALARRSEWLGPVREVKSQLDSATNSFALFVSTLCVGGGKLP